MGGGIGGRGGLVLGFGGGDNCIKNTSVYRPTDYPRLGLCLLGCSLLVVWHCCSLTECYMFWNTSRVLLPSVNRVRILLL